MNYFRRINGFFKLTIRNVLFHKPARLTCQSQRSEGDADDGENVEEELELSTYRSLHLRLHLHQATPRTSQLFPCCPQKEEICD